MEKYVITARLGLPVPAGFQIELADEDVGVRVKGGLLKPQGRGRYLTLKPQQFKAGQTIGLDKDLVPKAFWAGLSLVETEAGPEPPAGTAAQGDTGSEEPEPKKAKAKKG